MRRAGPTWVVCAGGDRLSHGQRDAGAVASRHHPEDRAQSSATSGETLSAGLDQTLWLVRPSRSNFMGIRRSAPRGFLKLPGGQIRGSAPLSRLAPRERSSAGRTRCELSCHHRRKREGNPGTAALDGLRFVLAIVFCVDMRRTGVVVVTYNSAEVIERCLDSCGDLPVVVVDN